jgi:hypothetical protein
LAGQVLGGIADTVAQTITAFKARASQRSQATDNDIISIEIHDLDKERPPALGELDFAKNRPPAFDFERITRFMAYGFFMAPVQFQWFKFLSRAFPITKRSATVPALKRVAVDQLMFAPIGTFFLRSSLSYLSNRHRSVLLFHLHDCF